MSEPRPPRAEQIVAALAVLVASVMFVLPLMGSPAEIRPGLVLKAVVFSAMWTVFLVGPLVAILYLRRRGRR